MALGIGTATAFPTSGAHTSSSFSHDGGSGTERLLLVGTKGRSGTATRTASAVTYNSVAMTEVPNSANINEYATGLYHAIKWWYLIAPATGSNTVAVTWSGSMTSSVVTAVTLTGAHQTAPIGNAAVADLDLSSSTTPSVNVATTANNAYIVAGAMMRRGSGGSFTPQGGAAELTDGESGAGTSQDILYNDFYLVAAGPTTYTLSTICTQSTQWNISAVEVKPTSLALVPPRRPGTYIRM